MPDARQLGAIETRAFGNVSNVSKFKLIAWVGENRQTALTVLRPAGAPKIQWIKQCRRARRRSCDYEPKANGSTIAVWSFPRIEFRNLSCFRHGDEALPRCRLYSDPLLRSAVKTKGRALRATFCQRISTPRSNSSTIKSLTGWFWRHLQNEVGGKSRPCPKKASGKDRPPKQTPLHCLRGN